MIVRNILVILSTALVVVFIASPFFKRESAYVLEVSTQIDGNVTKVFDYLGNSANASKWSVFVDTIMPLNSDVVNDGLLGSERRCIRERGFSPIVWDEEVVQFIQDSLRALTIYNLVNFPVSTSDLYTKQIYRQLDGEVRLTFGLYKDVEKCSMWDIVKMKVAGYYVKYIFNKNLRGIKREVENV